MQGKPELLADVAMPEFPIVVAKQTTILETMGEEVYGKAVALHPECHVWQVEDVWQLGTQQIQWYWKSDKRLQRVVEQLVVLPIASWCKHS